MPRFKIQHSQLSFAACALLLVLLLSSCDDQPSVANKGPQKPKLSKLDRPITLLVSPFRSHLKEVFQAVGQALSRRLGVPVTVKVSKSYEASIKVLEEDKADLYFLPALSYLRAANKSSDMRVLVSEEIRATLYDRAVLVVKANSTARKVKDLKEKRFALVSRNSASGYLFPRVCLKRHGLDPDKVLSKEKVVFAKDHDRAMKLLLENKVDVAATYDWAITEASGRLRSGLRVIAWSEPLPHSLLVGSAKLTVDEAELIQFAFLSLSREKAEDVHAIEAMELIGITGFSVLPTSALEPLRRMDEENSP